MSMQRRQGLQSEGDSYFELPSFITLSLRSVWRWIIAVVGATILIIGIALLVLPGPGWLTVIVGLGILGSEYVWARRLLRKVRHEIKDIQQLVRKEIRAR